MRDMHPSPRRQITPPADLGPGLQATTGHVAKALDALLSTDHTAMDFSGWSADLLLPVRGRPDIMHPIIDLLRAITNCEMPLEVYWLITVGSLVAIHKLDEDAQVARAALFLDPKLRPIYHDEFSTMEMLDGGGHQPQGVRGCRCAFAACSTMCGCFGLWI